MNQGKDPYSQGSNSPKMALMVIFLVIILVLAIFLIVKFKPVGKEYSTIRDETRNTPKEHIETIETSIVKIFNLANELLLYDELYDELIYNDNPEMDRIAEFVSNFKDYASLYSEDKDRNYNSDWFNDNYDSTIVSFERQQKFLERSIVSLLKAIENKKKIFISIPVIFPIAKEDAQIISGFGMREHPILDEPRMHTGIDIKAPIGTAIVATASGKVINTEEQIGFGYGRPCVIEHKFGYQTLYGHMVRLEVYKNKIVQKGEIIGRVGDTGLSQGPHLHYEVRKNGRPLNPSYFIFEGLSKEEYKKVSELGTQ